MSQGLKSYVIKNEPFSFWQPEERFQGLTAEEIDSFLDWSDDKDPGNNSRNIRYILI